LVQTVLLKTKFFANANMKSTFLFICSNVCRLDVVVGTDDENENEDDDDVVERKRPCARAEEFR
jgi:hypothetical protein